MLAKENYEILKTDLVVKFSVIWKYLITLYPLKMVELLRKKMDTQVVDQHHIWISMTHFCATIEGGRKMTIHKL
jgi:hypothetical protein